MGCTLGLVVSAKRSKDTGNTIQKGQPGGRYIVPKTYKLMHEPRNVQGLTDCGNFGQDPNSGLWDILPSGFLDSLLIVFLLPDICNRTETDAHDQAKETHANADCVKTMALTKNKDECRIEKEAQPIEIPIIQSSAYNDEFRSKEPEGPRECYSEHISNAPLFHVLRDIYAFPTAVQLAFLFNSPGEDDAVAGLSTVYQRGCHDDPQAAADGKQGPEDISPTSVVGHK
jgi:hypothetical protein